MSGLVSLAGVAAADDVELAIAVVRHVVELAATRTAFAVRVKSVRVE